MNATTVLTTATATLLTSAISLPSSVPSGYARQAQIEANRTHAFRPFSFFGV